MPKVTTEQMREIILAGCFLPRHQRGCPKNYARTLPLPLAAAGYSIEEIKAKVQEEFDNLPCECK